MTAAMVADSVTGIDADDLRRRVLYRDAQILVIDKPAGIPVHAGPKGGANLEDLFDALRFDLKNNPGLGHRLDRDTSGCLVLGRHAKALRRLGRLFSAGAVEKIYWAVVEGQPLEPEGRIALKLAKRSTAARGWWMKVAEDGIEAITDYRVLGRGKNRAWLELRPRTGRTHQIRVHCAASGFPVLGDRVYGARESTQALHLHARALALPLYPGRPAIAVSAPVPAHLAQALAALGFRGEDGLSDPLQR